MGGSLLERGRSWIVLAVLGIVLAAGVAVPAAAEPRIALVVTNQGYTQPGAALTNTHRDGDLVKAALEAVGFKVWVERDTANEGALTRAIGQHVERLTKAGPSAVGFLYYSGHGAADRPDGANYLIPTQAPITHVSQLPLMAVRLDKITASLAAVGKTSFVVFDACRNMALQRDGKDFGFKGFAPVREERDLLVAYATEPGHVAVDQSIYARALAEEIVKPGREAGQVFRAVTQRVEDATTPKQSPEFLDKRRRDFHFAAAAPREAASTKQPEPPLSAAAREWQDVKGSSNRAVLEAFRKRHERDPVYAALAEEVIAKLPPVAPATPAISPTPSPTPPTTSAAVAPPAPSSRCTGIEAMVLGTKRCLEPGNTITECPGCPEMVVVPGGSFMMGSPDNEEGRGKEEGPQQRVTVKAFAVGRYEVTFAEWDACVADGGCTHKPNDEGWGRGRRPVINVSWDDAKGYVAWIAAKTGSPYRLLTDAEWEYAARAGTTTPFHFGPTIVPAQANYNGNYTYGSGTRIGAKGVYRQRTIEVGSLNKPNAFGLHDVHGNVWEWVDDCYADGYAKAPADGSKIPGTKDCSRVLRGGSWISYPWIIRSAARIGSQPVNRLKDFGFRLARTLSPTP